MENDEGTRKGLALARSRGWNLYRRCGMVQ